MDVSPLAHYSMPAAGMRRKPASPPQFSGIGDGLSAVVSAFDRSKLLELGATDGAGFIAPRSFLAWWKRGTDDGRETLIREGTGLLGNILMVGALGYLGVKSIGDRLTPVNPHGIAASAFINSENLNAFNQHYHKALKESTNPAEARKRFLNGILGNIESANKTFSLTNQLNGLSLIDEEKQPRVLKQMLSQVAGEVEAGKIFSQHEALPLSERIKALTEAVKARSDGFGKLSKSSREELVQAFSQRKTMTAPAHTSLLTGTLPLDQEAQAHIAQWEKQGGDYATKLQQDPKFRQQEFLKTRMKLYKGASHQMEDFLRVVDKTALENGLTETVNIRATSGSGKKAEFLATGHGRKNTFKELKHYLEHYVDRAHYEAAQAAGHGEGAAQKMKVAERLFAPGRESFLGKFLPRADQGLVTSAIKAKSVYTGIPFVLTILSAGAFSFYNNYLTMKKHGGKVFFPGEGEPEMPMLPPLPPALAPAAMQVPPVQDRSFASPLLSSPSLSTGDNSPLRWRFPQDTKFNGGRPG